MQEVNTERHLLVCGEINADRATGIVEALESLKDSDEPIYISLCSPGGEAQPSLWVAEYIRNLPNWVIGIAGGDCSSAALLIFAACDERWAFPGTGFYSHPGIWEVPISNKLQAHAAVTQVAHLETSCDVIQRPAFPKMSKKQYSVWATEDHFFTVPEAVSYGLVHKVLAKTKKVKP